MSILLCNDDGIHAPGIRVLHESIKELDTIDIVAPIEEQSAVGHAITVFDPIKTSHVYKDNRFFGYGITGTPADCVKLAFCALFDNAPDFLISGINLGANTGISVIYSGTVSVATEATLFGIPSMALSLATFSDPLWETAAVVAQTLAPKLQKHKLPEGVLLNVNIPNVPIDEIKGYRITQMAHSRYNETFHKRTDPRGKDYYWLDGKMELLGPPENTDVRAIEQGYVSITPIGLDLTHYPAMEEIRKWEV